MKEYYPFIFIFNNKEYLTLWYSNDKDGFLTDNDKVKCFQSYDELTSFIKLNKLNFNDDKGTLSIDYAISWLNSNQNKIDCEYFLNYWNMLTDLSYSVGVSFYGDKNTKRIKRIYDKLFYGNNLEPVTPVGKQYEPIWDIVEIDGIRKVIKDGLSIVKNHVF